jgi:hypothetical protein
MVCGVVLFGPITAPPGVPAWALSVYPVALACVLVGYAIWLRDAASAAAAALVLACWLASAGWQWYLALRQVVTGLDQIVLGLVLFGVAILVSLAKAGALSRWAARREEALLAAVQQQPPGANTEVHVQIPGNVTGDQAAGP